MDCYLPRIRDAMKQVKAGLSPQSMRVSKAVSTSLGDEKSPLFAANRHLKAANRHLKRENDQKGKLFLAIVPSACSP